MINIDINKKILLILSVFVFLTIFEIVLALKFGIYALYVFIALVIGIIIFRKPIIGIYTLILISPLSVLTIIPVTGTSLFSFIGFYTIIVWILNDVLIKKKSIYTDKVFWSSILLLLWCLLSLFWATNIQFSLNKIFKAIQMFGLYLIIINLVKDKKTAFNLLILFIFGVFISSLLSTKELLTVGLYSYKYRMTLKDLNPNAMGVYAGIAIIFTLYLFNQIKRALKPFAILILTFLLIAFIFAESRGAWIAMGGTILFLIYNNRTAIIKFRKYIFRILLIFVLLVSGYFLTRKISSIRLNALEKRVNSIFEVKENPSSQSRISFWKVGLEIWKDHPILGVGLWNFPEYFPEYTGTSAKRDPHSVYVGMLVDLGIIGLLLWLFLLFNVYKKANNNEYKNLTLSLLCFLVLLSFKGSYIWDPVFWFIFAEISVLWKLSETKYLIELKA